jgi:hypothetical protein
MIFIPFAVARRVGDPFDAAASIQWLSRQFGGGGEGAVTKRFMKPFCLKV